MIDLSEWMCFSAISFLLATSLLSSPTLHPLLHFYVLGTLLLGSFVIPEAIDAVVGQSDLSDLSDLHEIYRTPFQISKAQSSVRYVDDLSSISSIGRR
jgi:hypothetical protein